MRYLIIETPLFSKLLPDYLTDEEYLGLQEYLCVHPDAGDWVRGSGAQDSIPGHVLKALRQEMENAED
jgi:hypothetical protein